MTKTKTKTAAAAVIAAAALTMTMTTSAPAHAAEGGRYVALGDSYAATGSVTTLPDLGPQRFACQRSDDSYAEVVARRTGMALTNASCGGATTGSYWGPTRFGPVVVPPQREAVTPDTDLVTLQYGGNPHVVWPVAPACVPAALGAPAGPCEAAVAGVDTAAMQNQLQGIIVDVKARAPQAKVLLVGYLPLAPRGGVACPALGWANPGSVAAVGKFVENLNGAMANAAAAEGVRYVAPPDDGQGVCAPAGSRRVSALGPVTGDDAVPGHPTSVGHAAVADAVTAAL